MIEASQALFSLENLIITVILYSYCPGGIGLRQFYNILCKLYDWLKFIYSEKATKCCETLTLLLTVCTVVKSKVKISQNFVAFSEYMNFTENTFQMHFR